MRNYDTIRLKYVADVYNGNSIPDNQKDNYTNKEIPYIPTKEIDADTGSINYDNGLSVAKTDAFRIAPPQSTIMCIEGGSAGRKIGFTDRPVAFVNKLCCFVSKKCYPRYLYYCLQSKDFLEQFYLSMTGLIGGVSVSDLKNLKIANPNCTEIQKAIACFLDTKSAQIDALIANEQAQIEKLKQYKQSLITEVVTKGLDPNTPMKDSGVEWIGKIPEHWEFSRKLAFLTTEGISYGIVKLFDPDDENGVKVIRCSDVLEGFINPDNIRTVTQEVSNEYARTLLAGGEVLVNVRGSLGGCAVVPESMVGYNIAREVAKISLKPSMCNRYVMYFLLSRCFVEYRTRHLSGSVYVGLNIELLSSCPLPNPKIEEQILIADYLDSECGKIDKVISYKESKIEKLTQYKKSLIYEYVTGKKEIV